MLQNFISTFIISTALSVFLLSFHPHDEEINQELIEDDCFKVKNVVTTGGGNL